MKINAFAEENKCLANTIEEINLFSQELDNCKIDYADSEWLTFDMLNAYNEAISCAKSVVHKIFDKY